jgi:hypothetical protein
LYALQLAWNFKSQTLLKYFFAAALSRLHRIRYSTKTLRLQQLPVSSLPQSLFPIPKIIVRRQNRLNQYPCSFNLLYALQLAWNFKSQALLKYFFAIDLSRLHLIRYSTKTLRL